MANATVEEKLVNVEVRLAKLEGTVEARERDLPSRLDRVESRLDGVESQLHRVEQRLSQVEGRLDRLDQRMSFVESRLDRLDQKVDRIPWFILASWVTIMLALMGGLYIR
jgi:predicted nuclease with TOPRIM domain